MTQDMKKPPAANQGQSQNQNDVTPILPEHAGLVHGTHVAVAVIQVRGDHNPPRYRRRVMLSLASASRLVDRATADGLDASVILCRLMPAAALANGVLDD